MSRVLKIHLPDLLYHLTHPITNAMREGFNPLIQTIKANASSLPNFTNFRDRILFCGTKLKHDARLTKIPAFCPKCHLVWDIPPEAQHWEQRFLCRCSDQTDDKPDTNAQDLCLMAAN